MATIASGTDLRLHRLETDLNLVRRQIAQLQQAVEDIQISAPTGAKSSLTELQFQIL
jgi:hypothetical protein